MQGTIGMGALAPKRGPVLALVLGIALTCIGLSCQQRSSESARPDPAPAPPWFKDITDEVGLDFVHDAGPTGSYFLPQIMGSGAAIFDFDNDGLPDLYLLQNAGPASRASNKLYRQLPNGHFQDVSKDSGLAISGYNMGVAIGDVNNDGWPDVLVTQVGGIRLFLNNGDGRTFTEVTKQAGLEHRYWATSACFVDYDRDGWLDLVVTNYLDYNPSVTCNRGSGQQDYCHPSNFEGTVTKLYHNRGRAAGTTTVSFEDVTRRAGLGRLRGPGLGVACADFDGDGWPDIFVANDGQPNRLWINQKNGTFREEAVLHGLAYNGMGQAQANMGIALGDVRGDGRLDVFVTHLTEETPTLWQQIAPGQFQDDTVVAGLARPRWRGTGFGTVLADFNLDGMLDLAIANGRVAARVGPAGAENAGFWAPYAERNQLFAGEAPGRFRDVSKDNDPLCGTAGVYRGLACGDLNGDGALDLLVTEVAGRARLYRNVAPDRGHWLVVRAVDPALHRDAYGAEVIVHAAGRRWVSWVNPGQSYLCSNDPRAHFGLGPVSHVDRLEVLWPDGLREVFPGGALDRSILLRRGKGTPVPK
jgi:hypothetical protein